MATQQKSLASYFTATRVAGLVLAVLAVAFIVQNRVSTSIQVFWVEVSTPLWFTLLSVFVIGWVVGVLTSRRRADGAKTH